MMSPQVLLNGGESLRPVSDARDTRGPPASSVIGHFSGWKRSMIRHADDLHNRHPRSDRRGDRRVWDALPNLRGVLWLLMIGWFLATAWHPMTAAETELAADSKPSKSEGPRMNGAGTSPPGSEIKSNADGTYTLGRIRLDKNRKTITFPAQLNMVEGPLEYLLVTETGKRHESILVTPVAPVQIHAAMLLLGVTTVAVPNPPVPVTGGSALKSSEPSEPNEAGIRGKPASERIPGHPVEVQLEWVHEGKRVRRSAESILINTNSPSRSVQGAWVYNGSRLINRTFMAEEIGSIISLITDPDALANNEAGDHDNDDVWSLNLTLAPPWKTEIEVSIRMVAQRK